MAETVCSSPIRRKQMSPFLRDLTSICLVVLTVMREDFLFCSVFILESLWLCFLIPLVENKTETLYKPVAHSRVSFREVSSHRLPIWFGLVLGFGLINLFACV